MAAGGITSARNRTFFENLPNYLTLSRLVLIVPFIVFMVMEANRVPGPWRPLAGWIWIVASLTDYADGYLARRFNLITPLGKLLDPLADKLMTAIGFVMIIPLNCAPTWAIAVILGRELAITGLRGIAADEGIVIAAMPLGKVKAVFEFLAVAGYILDIRFLWGSTYLFAHFMFWGAFATALLSGLDYIWRFIAYLREQEAAVGGDVDEPPPAD